MWCTWQVEYVNDENTDENPDEFFTYLRRTKMWQEILRSVMRIVYLGTSFIFIIFEEINELIIFK